MESTSSSLLLRLRRPGEQAAWKRFIDLYTPLLHSWACRAALPAQDAADLVQDVFVALVQKLPQFQYQPGKGSFRAWLRPVAPARDAANGRQLRFQAGARRGHPPLDSDAGVDQPTTG